MSITGIALVFVAAAMTMAANLMLRAGIDAAGGFAPSGPLGMVISVAHLFIQPLFSGGFVIYVLASLVWFRVVATEPLSIAYPVLVSLTFSMVTAGAVLLFNEPLTVRKLAGLVVILTGIVLISFGNNGS